MIVRARVAPRAAANHRSSVLKVKAANLELDKDSVPEGIVVADGGLVKLSRGIAELTGIRPHPEEL